jgi:hypothetical protein
MISEVRGLNREERRGRGTPGICGISALKREDEELSVMKALDL